MFAFSAEDSDEIGTVILIRDHKYVEYQVVTFCDLITDEIYYSTPIDLENKIVLNITG